MPRFPLALMIVCLATRAIRAEPPFASSRPAASQPATSHPALDAFSTTRTDEPLQQLQDALETLVDRIGPAVVAIQTDRRPAPSERPAASPLAWLTNGSGVLIRDDGMILTSQHVIEGALAIHVTLHDGRDFRARRVAADPRADLAVIQIAASRLAIAELGDVRSVRRGHFVLAMGNPLGLAADGQAAVSLGIVSAIGRPLPGTVGRDEDRYYGDMIQTSAPINPGHSGGPLVDLHGRVIGVLTALGVGGDSGGIAFAVPIGARTRLIIDRLLAGESIEYGYLGVEVVNLTEAQVHSADLTTRSGALVDAVVPHESAADAGLQSGDIILSVDRQPVASADDFVSLIGAIEPGRTTRIEFLRGDRRAAANATVGRRPPSVATDAATTTIEFRGAVLQAVPAAMREAIHLPANALLVVMVGAGTPCDRAGLTPGDIIVRVNGRAPSGDVMASLPALTDECLLGLASGNSLLIKPE